MRTEENGDGFIFDSLGRTERGCEPSLFGEGLFEVEGEPASIQSKAKAKSEFVNRVKESIKGQGYFLVGDVTLDVYWYLHPKIRYQTDQSPDIDNILKPLIDGLCGLEGILIDDCQISRVNSQWVGWMNLSQQKLLMKVGFSPDDFLPRDGLFFVQFSDGLCYPFNLMQDPRVLRRLLLAWALRLRTATRLEHLLGVNAGSDALRQCPRPFHRTRLSSKFPVFTYGEARRRLRSHGRLFETELPAD